MRQYSVLFIIVVAVSSFDKGSRIFEMQTPDKYRKILRDYVQIK